MTAPGRLVSVIGRLGIYPMANLSLPARRVLAFLAINPGPVDRGRAASALWPDLPDAQARSNLRRALWLLPRGWTTTSGDDIVLQAESDLPAAQVIGARAIDGGLVTLKEITLLSSDLLPGWNEEWAFAAQDAFRLLRVQALEAACRTMAAAGQHALATQAGLAALAAEPLRESAAAALIEAHLAQRNRYEATRCYRALATRLMDELGVDPDPLLAQRMSDAGLAAALR